jgi:hypothetical protein
MVLVLQTEVLAKGRVEQVQEEEMEERNVSCRAAKGKNS